MPYANALPLVLTFSVGSLFVAWWLARWVLKKDTGTAAMQEISNAIKLGAEAFLRRQNGTIAILALLLAALIFLLYGFVRSHQGFDPVPTALGLAFWTTLSFVLGASCVAVTCCLFRKIWFCGVSETITWSTRDCGWSTVALGGTLTS